MNNKINFLATLVFIAIVIAGLAYADLPEPARPPYKIGLKSIHPVPIKWETISEGFDRTVLMYEGETSVNQGKSIKSLKRQVELVVFRVDTKKYPLKVVTARSVVGQNVASLKSIHEKTGALLTVNGGFFSEEGDPIGLVISKGKLVNSYNQKGGSGALAIYKGIPKINFVTAIMKSKPKPDYAVQNGPILVDPGGKFGINVIADHYYYRTIVALDRKGRFLIGVTRKKYLHENIEEGINLYEAAAIFYHTPGNGGLHVDAALNMDGGTSTGMLFNFKQHEDKVPIAINVPNFLCIMPGK